MSKREAVSFLAVSRELDCFWCGAVLVEADSVLVCPDDGACFEKGAYMSDLRPEAPARRHPLEALFVPVHRRPSPGTFIPAECPVCHEVGRLVDLRSPSHTCSTDS
jgi:hypothetical protein